MLRQRPQLETAGELKGHDALWNYAIDNNLLDRPEDSALDGLVADVREYVGKEIFQDAVRKAEQEVVGEG